MPQRRRISAGLLAATVLAFLLCSMMSTQRAKPLPVKPARDAEDIKETNSAPHAVSYDPAFIQVNRVDAVSH